MVNVINVCLACDDNYAQYAGVVITSVLTSSAEDDYINFYILDGGISDEKKLEISSLTSLKKCEINFVQIDSELFEDYKQIKTHDYITISTYYRLKLPSLLPHIKRILYFDCDFIINSSLKDLFETDIGDAPIAGVLDIDKRKVHKNPTYVNAGMLLMDLENMRKLDLENKFLDWTRKHKDTITCGDQEIINEVCRGNIKIVDEEWNVQSSNFTNRSSYTRSPKGIHFVAKKKPWHFGSFSYHKNYYFKNLQLSPWKLSDKEYFKWTFWNELASLYKYFLYRPLFLFRFRFYQAVYFTYLKPQKKEDL